MEPKYYRSWHLAKNEEELQITEFEYSIIRFNEAFLRWISTVGSIVIASEMSYSEHLILHVVRMQDRPKTSAIIGRMINRDDIPNIQYSLRKLEAAGLIRKFKEKGSKTYTYAVTPLGIKATDEYSILRSELLVDNLKSIGDLGEHMGMTTQVLSLLIGIYEEASRNASTFNHGPQETQPDRQNP